MNKNISDDDRELCSTRTRNVDILYQTKKRKKIVTEEEAVRNQVRPSKKYWNKGRMNVETKISDSIKNIN